jgi:endonuclease III
MTLRPTQIDRARRIILALEKRYGSPRLNNKDDPLDELIFILLSQMTTGPRYERGFDRLKVALGGWDRLLFVAMDDIKTLIADAGLSNQKAPHLVAIARRLYEDFGTVTLSPLAALNDEQVERYLVSLSGVGLKTAKCVMMYSLSRQVLPVDTHVQRVATRLGLLSPTIARPHLHRALEVLVRPDMRYAFHVNAVAHGRSVCRARAPLCPACPVASFCPSAKLAV